MPQSHITSTERPGLLAVVAVFVLPLLGAAGIIAAALVVARCQ